MTKCDDCKEKEFTKFDITGHKLCSDCFNKWDERRMKLHKEMIEELNKKKIENVSGKNLMDF